MLHVTPMPMPGALRLRALHPLIEGDGSCGLLYDLERAAVVEVPEDLQFYIAPALETGDLDEALLGWLVNEDLLTTEGGAGGLPEAAAWWNLGAIYRVDGELHARIEGVREEAILEFLAFVFKQSHGTSRVKLHLSWDGAYPGNRLLERIVVESSRLAGLQGQEVAFELTLAAAEVTAARAEFLAGYSFQVRLLCGSYPVSSLADRCAARTAWKIDPVVRLLLDSLGDRLTVHCVLDHGRLLDLWEWAKSTGIRHLDATVTADSAAGDGLAHPGRRLELRNDLLALCEEMADELAAQRFPIDYKPLTRVVDRLMRSEPLAHSYDERGGFAGPVPIADSYPRAFLESFDLLSPAGLGDVAGEDTELEAVEAGEAAFPCQGCWARHVCNHSMYVAAAQESEEAPEISEESCSLWRAEVEVALRFYHRLAHTDPLQVRRFFDDLTREPAPAPALREDLGYLRMPF
ncbi:MAG TPA: hypothetical protein VGX68_16530 [Thermoanaerobaculia bacterium]|jgi:hypothetical protein|nr:hypothetical protein [Thermoanaerobaculia bacterium]